LEACAENALSNGITHGMSTRKPSATIAELVMIAIQGRTQSTPVTFANSYRNSTIQGLKACAERALLNGTLHSLATQKLSEIAVKLGMFRIQGQKTIHPS
jgi:hypothetical protein